MQHQGWTLLFHQCVIEQLQKLEAAVTRAHQHGSADLATNNNSKLYQSLSYLMLNRIPTNPALDEYRQGNTLGKPYRHWRRAKFHRRFRLFFRYDSKARIIIYGWVNDESSLRAAGSQSDPYTIFRKMLERKNPPDQWNDLVRTSKEAWK